MIFPFVIASQEKQKGLENWNKQFVSTGRCEHEGVWRRTQSEQNKEKSLWSSDFDQRWRVVHFLDNYDIFVKSNKSYLVLKGVYLKINHSLPKKESEDLLSRILKEVKSSGLKYTETSNGFIFHIGDLNFEVSSHCAEDQTIHQLYPDIPDNYSIVDLEIMGGKSSMSPDRKFYPWKILKKGFRKILEKGNPTYSHCVKDILKYKPFQVELGCGPSMEAGIYPLSYLHRVYQTTDLKSNTFIFGENDHLCEDIIKNPELFYIRATKIMTQSWLTEGDLSFYFWLKDAHTSGLIVGPIITNNYDGITSRVGLPELYVRKFKEQFIVPKIKFAKEANSLLVVGSHADRRLVQQSAREQGLKVIFVDPEEYVDDLGQHYKYPLEAPQNEDLVLKMKSTDFVKEIKKFL